MKRVLINFSANIRSYRAEIHDYNGKKIFNFNKSNNCVWFCAISDDLTIVLSPLINGYNSKLFIKLNAKNSCSFNISYNFSKKITPAVRTYYFSLTDKFYGLKINGNLMFTSK